MLRATKFLGPRLLQARSPSDFSWPALLWIPAKPAFSMIDSDLYGTLGAISESS